jgi:leucyl-tRNA synthetase
VDVRAVIGVYKFLQRIHRLVTVNDLGESSEDLTRALHSTLKKVSEDIPKLKFNTAIAELMKLSNAWEVAQKSGADMTTAQKEMVAKMFAPFAPFLADELYHQVTGVADSEFVHTSTWPAFDPELAKAQAVIIPVQINGKVRDQLEVCQDLIEDKDAILEMARTVQGIQKYLAEGVIKKEIYVPGKIVNFVVT